MQVDIIVTLLLTLLHCNKTEFHNKTNPNVVLLGHAAIHYCQTNPKV